MEYRGYIIVSDKTFGYYEVKHTGKGSLPNMLSGKYTRSSFAKKDIDSYLSEKEKKIESKQE